MKRLGRDSAALADRLTAHGIALAMLTEPLTRIYDPTGTSPHGVRGSAQWLLTESQHHRSSEGKALPTARKLRERLGCLIETSCIR
jgi:hypothetical protein